METKPHRLVVQNPRPIGVQSPLTLEELSVSEDNKYVCKYCGLPLQMSFIFNITVCMNSYQCYDRYTEHLLNK